MKSLNIYGVRYKILKVEDIDDGATDARVDYEARTISVTNDSVASLLHEVFHASFHETGIVQGVPDEVCEIIVENLSRLVDNLFILTPRKRSKHVKANDS